GGEHAPVEVEPDGACQHVRAGRVHRERHPGQVRGQVGQPGRHAEHRPRPVRRVEQPPHHRYALGDLVHPGRLPTASRTAAPVHDPVTEPPVRPGSPPTVACVRTTTLETTGAPVGTVEDPPRRTSAPPPRSRTPRRRSGGGVIFLPPWTRAPFLPFRQPAVILAVLGAALI